MTDKPLETKDLTQLLGQDKLILREASSGLG